MTKLASHFELRHVDTGGADGAAALKAALVDADGAIGSSVTIDADAVSGAHRLKVLSTVSVGIDKFDVADLTARGIILTHTPNVLTETTADLVFALLIGAARRVTELSDYVRSGAWEKSGRGIGPAQFAFDVHHKTLGVIGFGRIGQAVAKRGALGFGMKVLYTSPRHAHDAERAIGAERVSLDELLEKSDFVCLQAPLTEKTRHMMGAEQFAKMKRGAIIVNGGRGPLIDEAALAEALRSGHLGGAGLDVFDQEPLPASAPLLAFPNVLALPHAGSATQETRDAMAMDAVENLISVLVSGPPLNVANPDVLNSSAVAR